MKKTCNNYRGNNINKGFDEIPCKWIVETAKKADTTKLRVENSNTNLINVNLLESLKVGGLAQ